MIRIALIDDHEMVREGLRAILDTEPDFDVVAESGSADDVVRLVDLTRPNVVLLDARLPGVSGPAACRQLATSHPEVAVLIVSTYSDDELVDECISAGAKGYLIKDIERFSLKESIRAVHRGEGAVSPTVAGKVLDRLRRAEKTEKPAAPALSDGQRVILRLIAEGFSNREIASRVYLSENTVKSHVQEIFRKLDVRNRVEAAILATKEGWL
ncbi:MAG TPA: response regulator transcription factor [Acidimicrobiales bacterium]|jgi:DNA-binding NarL/FixJ family response regulator|nr:response regulator transcription factor [Acidimicrobiales bacterium]